MNLKTLSHYLDLLSGYKRMGPLLLSLRILPNTPSAKLWILLLGMRRFNQGCGTSHKPFALSLSSDTCTLSKNSTYVTSDWNNVEGMYLSLDSSM